MIIKPKVRGFLCVTTHPAGCEANVKNQIDYVSSQGAIVSGPKRVLILGASTGYGLASRIVSTFGAGASTIGRFPLPRSAIVITVDSPKSIDAGSILALYRRSPTAPEKPSTSAGRAVTSIFRSIDDRSTTC